ncbi:uncharacterized protein LOC110693751 [Chenopodium quinoa]|uniref:uncharacterized protein LOC110693751 n=1 Tax=Chenopodium quinoa TaxID=63459 RepID=UPI000B791B7C|nr:uncharacterized protein LOC110693751 [Chenopodium quinoa]
MSILKPCKYSNYNNHNSSLFQSINSKFALKTINTVRFYRPNVNKLCTVRASYAGGEARNNEDGAERKSFLSLEEAGLVEISGLSVHERFLCRLTISSLNLLRVIAEQEGCSIEELNAGRICDWFLKDKLKREQNIGSAVLQWDDDDPFAGQF